MASSPSQTELYVSCRPQRPPKAFCVEPGKACLLQACGLAPDQTVPVLKSYGGDQCEPARDLIGNLIILTAEKPSAVVGLPGNYKLDVSDLSEDPCVYITEECLDAAGGLAYSTAFCTRSLVPGTGLVEVGADGTCWPVYFVYDCITGAVDCVRLDPETKEMTMALKPIPAPTGEETCEKYPTRFVAVDSTSGVTDLAGLVAFAAANDPGDGEYPTLGPVDPAADKVIAVTLSPRPEDGADMVLVDGVQQGGYQFNAVTDGDYSDVSATALEVPEPCNFIVTVCFMKCVDKAGNPV